MQNVINETIKAVTHVMAHLEEASSSPEEMVNASKAFGMLLDNLAEMQGGPVPPMFALVRGNLFFQECASSTIIANNMMN